MELIRIDRSEISGAAVQTVNARDLHSFLGVRKDFSDWIKAQVTRAHLVENEDFLIFPQKGENSGRGRPTSDYALTLEAGKHIAMMAGTPKGLPAQGKLSGNISRALDAYCKRHACLSRSAQVGSREVTHWPEDAVIGWLSEQGHEMIRRHLAQPDKGKVSHLRAV